MGRQTLAAVLAGLLILQALMPAPAAAAGYGQGKQLGDLLLRCLGESIQPQKPHRIVHDKAGRERRQTLNPQKALRQIDQARSIEELDRIIADLATYQDPCPGDLIALALRKRGRLQYPWWHPGRWLLDPGQDQGWQTPPLLPVTGGAALLLYLLASRGMMPM